MTPQTKLMHTKAMELAHKALLKNRQGFILEGLKLNRKAYDLERQVAISLLNDQTDNKYLLLYSAACLAINCNMLEEAKDLALKGLDEKTPLFHIKRFEDILKKLKPKTRS